MSGEMIALMLAGLSLILAVLAGAFSMYATAKVIGFERSTHKFIVGSPMGESSEFTPDVDKNLREKLQGDGDFEAY